MDEAGLVELHTIEFDGDGNQVMTAFGNGLTIEPGGSFEPGLGAGHS